MEESLEDELFMIVLRDFFHSSAHVREQAFQTGEKMVIQVDPGGHVELGFEHRLFEILQRSGIGTALVGPNTVGGLRHYLIHIDEDLLRLVGGDRLGLALDLEVSQPGAADEFFDLIVCVLG